ncbi:hypothetical protein [Patulibacter minatonensis]|uniref:hypothetical protein n=1 Tax=Patulibacter minatonensis TaxID=298163 RepID=UPI00047ED2B0|nr:hypothetical protein [Patulibacter minatonensis]
MRAGLVLARAVAGLAGCGGGDEGPTVQRSATATHAGLVRDLDAACDAENRALAALDPVLQAAKDPAAAAPVFARVAGIYRDHVRAVAALPVPAADAATAGTYLRAADDVAAAAGRFADAAGNSSGSSEDAAAVLKADGVRRGAAATLGARGCTTFR